MNPSARISCFERNIVICDIVITGYYGILYTRKHCKFWAAFRCEAIERFSVVLHQETSLTEKTVYSDKVSGIGGYVLAKFDCISLPQSRAY